MPTSSLVRDALFETGRIWPVRPGPVTRDQRLGHDPLRRIPGTGASRHYRLAGDTPATSAGISACAGMGGRVLSHPQEEPLTTAGAAELRARPGPAGSWGHERLIGWRCL